MLFTRLRRAGRLGEAAPATRPGPSPRRFPAPSAAIFLGRDGSHLPRLAASRATASIGPSGANGLPIPAADLRGGSQSGPCVTELSDCFVKGQPPFLLSLSKDSSPAISLCACRSL